MSIGVLTFLLLLQSSGTTLPVDGKPINLQETHSFSVITDGPGSQLFDLSYRGKLSKPRAVKYQTTSSFGFICLAEAPQGNVWYSVSQAESGSSHPQHLFSLVPSGLASVTGMINPPFTEGDCAFDPTDQTLWAVRAGGDLYTIGTNPLAAKLKATIQGVSDVSAMAFDKSGQLYCIDLGVGGKIHRIDKTNGKILASLSLPPNTGKGNAAMAIDPTNNGVAFAILPIFNGSSAVQTLYRIDLKNGAITPLGETGATRLTGMIAKFIGVKPRKP